MWVYEKKLEHPVNIKSKDLQMAKFLMAQYGGPDGELGASIRYLSQRYTMPTGKTKGLLTDIGTEELAHVEMIAAMIYQLTKNASPEELKGVGLGAYFTEHDNAIFPADANGIPWTGAYIQSIGDPITDLTEDMAAEQKARTTYEHLLKLTDDPDIKDPLKFLWAREVIHFQRFGEALVEVETLMQNKKYY
jgi:spore coat protein JC